MRVLAVSLAMLLSLPAGSVLAAKSDIMPAPHKAPRVPVQQVTLYEATPTYDPPPKPGEYNNKGEVKLAAKTVVIEGKSSSSKSKEKEPSAKELAKQSKVGKNPHKETTAKETVHEVAKDALKDSKEFEGVAKALDGERLMIGEKEIRLFGIVTPGISSNYGPQARQKLDGIIKGAVLCKVTDKDAEGRPIAFCGTVDTPDLSYEMLRQGWAMVDRKALKNNSLAEVYEKVEQEAQSLNKGLFAPMPMVNSVPLSNPSNTTTVPLVVANASNLTAQSTAPVTAMGAKIETVKQDEVKPDAPKTETVNTNTAISLVLPAGTVPATTPTATATKPVAAKETPKAEPTKTETAKEEPAPTGGSWFERYQGIIGGLLWVFGALGFGIAALVRDRVQLVEKRRALAAALNGELTAARHICRTRARELVRNSRRLAEAETQPRPSQLWPRIRAVVYQAHVGTIGLLGSDLARRVASVYGQCADYAAYYQQASIQRLPTATAVSETLSNLADHIDNILDGLAHVEYTGQPYIPEPIEEIPVTDYVDQEEVQEQQQAARASVNEEARVIRERFERMATSMVDMLGRKRETGVDLSAAPAPAPVAAPVAAPAAVPVVSAQAAEADDEAEKASEKPSQAA